MDTTIKITVEGLTPLICNRFTDEAAMKATSGNKIGLVGDKGTPKEIAESKLYTDSKGKEIVPGPNLFRCLIDAGKFFKAGKSKVTTIKTSLLPACVELVELELPITTKEGWQVDTRPVRIPSTGGRILAHRPMFHDWKLSFTCVVDSELMAIKLFRDIVDAAGRRIGLGDFRPDCKGPYGKFVVTSWKESKSKK